MTDLEIYKENYNRAVKDLACVSKGGEDYVSCSFMDIAVRIDRRNVAREKLIVALGEEAFKEVLHEYHNKDDIDEILSEAFGE